jgi:peptide/nickel transport system permease protein
LLSTREVHLAWARLLRDRAAFFGFITMLLLIGVAISAPILPIKDPISQDLQKANRAPSFEHPFGTDPLGRDVLSRIIWGSRPSLVAGVIAVAIGLTAGLVLGLTSGYAGGHVDMVIMRVMDLLLSIPYFLLALLVVATLGPSLTNAMIAVGIGFIPSYARLIRGCVLAVKEEWYVKGAVALGCSGLRIVIVHILPNILTPITVFSTLRIAEGILATAALGFIGLGAQPPHPEWGLMLRDATNFLFVAPHAVFFPAAMITLTALSFNLIGDGLRDVLDPYYRY